MSAKKIWWNLLWVAAFLFGGNVAAAMADLPASRNVSYSLRETPGDPQSPVVMTVTLHLVADHADGNAVAWTVQSATIDQPGPNPRQWVDGEPKVDTAGGFWWIDHADPLNPTTDEFFVPPAIGGIAQAQDPSYEDARFSLEGVANPQEPPPAGSSVARIELRAMSEPEPPEPQEPIDDEPVDVESTGD